MVGRWQVLFGLVGALAAGQVQAESKQAPVTHSGKTIVAEPDEVVYQDSSEFHRQNKQFSVVAELFGIVSLPGSGLAAGYYLNPDNLIELSYHKAELDFGIVKLGSSLTEVRLKHWFGNSFYVNGGVGMRSITGEATLEPLTGNDDITSSVEASSIGASLSIGNRWQWEYFSIGCDWVGTFQPLSTTKAEVKDSGATEEDKEKAEDDVNGIAEQNSGMLLRFYLGASF